MQLNFGVNDLKDFDFMAFLPILLPLLFIQFILLFIALIDLYRNKDVRNNTLIWTLIILFVNTIGPILYLVLGRKERGQH